jgi:hypothetical protein
VASGSVVLLEESRNGIGHGDIEIEGSVGSVTMLNPAGESRFLINGKTVVVRPGQTTIREGNKSRSVADVTVGRQVHVKGVWLTSEAGVQPVLAHEIKLQGGTEPPPTTPPANDKCVAAGAKAEVEGLIEAKGGSSITVRQQGKGDYQCEVSGGTRIRKGSTSYTFAQLQPGWRVHVSGSGMGVSGSLCRVQADEIKVQQDK